MWNSYSTKFPDRQKCSLPSGDWRVKLAEDGSAVGAFRRPVPNGLTRVEYAKLCPKVFTDSPEHREMWDIMFFRDDVVRSSSMNFLKMFAYVYDTKDYSSWETFMNSLGGKISVVDHKDWHRINVGKHFIEISCGMMFD